VLESANMTSQLTPALPRGSGLSSTFYASMR